MNTGLSHKGRIGVLNTVISESAALAVTGRVLYVAENLLVCFTESSNDGSLFEHLDSTGTKIVMSGPVECQLCDRRNIETNTQTNL